MIDTGCIDEQIQALTDDLWAQQQIRDFARQVRNGGSAVIVRADAVIDCCTAAIEGDAAEIHRLCQERDLIPAQLL